MPSYHVVWEIDIEADTPLEAAHQARHYQTKPDTTADVFDVTEDGGETFHIDLTAIREDEDGHCRTCGQPYEDGGDGYDGECPDCADKTFAAEFPEENYRNYYEHCGQEWSEVADSMCNDKCPVCNAEITPYNSEEIDDD